MRIAILADIHGNLPALEAVLADLTVQSPDAVYLAGDQINRCPFNNEVMELIADHAWPAIYGNHEWVIARVGTPDNPPPFTDRNRFPSLWWSTEHLTPDHLETVRRLPAEQRLEIGAAPPIRLLHGVPDNPFVGLMPDASDGELTPHLEQIAESVVVTGHTHRPLARCVGRWQLYNPGSVGLPYNGDPRAQYMILESGVDGWRPIFRRLDYDRNRVVAAFDTSGYRLACGPLGELFLRTVLTAEPWASDFGHWMHFQPAETKQDIGRAVAEYVQQHGPGRWAFQSG